MKNSTKRTFFIIEDRIIKGLSLGYLVYLGMEVISFSTSVFETSFIVISFSSVSLFISLTFSVFAPGEQCLRRMKLMKGCETVQYSIGKSLLMQTLITMFVSISTGIILIYTDNGLANLAFRQVIAFFGIITATEIFGIFRSIKAIFPELSK